MKPIQKARESQEQNIIFFIAQFIFENPIFLLMGIRLRMMDTVCRSDVDIPSTFSPVWYT